MLNYIKSEFYRLSRSKDLYLLTGICSGLIILMNIVLAISVRKMENFPYGTTRFSFGTLISQTQMLLLMAFIAASFVFGDEYKHHTLKNSISFGLSRTKIFCGKYIVSLVSALVCFAIIMACYVASAYILLENSGSEVLRELFLSMAGTIPSAIFSLTLAIALFFIIENGMSAALVWSGIIIALPLVMKLMGARIKICYEISHWLPWTMLSGNTVNQSAYSCIWDTPSGMIHCFIVGIVSSVVFFVIGLRLFQKRDII